MTYVLWNTDSVNSDGNKLDSNQLEKLEAARSAFLLLPLVTFPGITRPYWALLGLTGPYWALLGLTWPYWALLGLTGPYFAFV